MSSSISTLEGELSSLKTGTTDAEKKKYSKKKADINSKLADARAQLSKAQADMEKYKTQLDEANEKLQTLQANLKTQQDTLSLLEADMAELQEKVTSLISAQNGNGSGEFSGLAKSFENYNNLLTEFDTTKAELLSAAQTDYDELSTYQNELRDKLIEKEAIATSSKFRVTGFETEYNFEGANFDVVGINGFDSLDEFTRYVINSGLTNTGQYGTMQCFNYSIQMGKLALGVAEDVVTEAFLQETQNPDFGDIDLAGKLSRQHEYNQRCFMQTKSSDRSAEMSIMANELQSGRPCVVSVPYEGGSHYVLAVGIRQGASEPYQQSDFLCVDSYSGKILTLGERRKLATGNGIFVYSEGYHYKNGDGVYIPDYFSWVRNQYA